MNGVDLKLIEFWKIRENFEIFSKLLELIEDIKLINVFNKTQKPG